MAAHEEMTTSMHLGMALDTTAKLESKSVNWDI